MRIAEVAPLYESVPPKLYGGTERIVSYLTEELVKEGHDVTLFASGDSKTKASLVSVIPEALRLNKKCEDTIAPHVVQLQEVKERADEFDIIHFHTDYLSFPFTECLKTPHLTTLHGKLSIPELQFVYEKFKDQPVVCISDAQCLPLPQANFIGRVHHGLPAELFHLASGTGEYFAYLGRISPEKRCDRAIEIAIASNTPIKIAAKIDKADQEYFERHIQHLFQHPLVEYLGEINEIQKQDFLGNAKALLFPIDWPEPFGLVMIEAMACGTPIIGWDMGSVPEVLENGKNGFIVHTIEEALGAVKKLPSIDRSTVRTVFEEKFTARRMTAAYLNIFQNLIEENKTPYLYNAESLPLKVVKIN
ncbi:glycosyltransferase family 4 protein [Flavisolibacter tropicus]|uniref:Glycosyl transferase n=1 Tax=Flavisolibacter tropicus TaxID=1492898 RepID=A0A172TUP9_9BACT|nr:glycosyltransferase family 4 protein [Flavisolibacter tropicus]ANE50815.1 glycosyl transferase [Flavisolibacter tropicus]